MNSVRFINLENCFFMLVIKLNIAVNTVDFLFHASTQFLGFNRESTVHVCSWQITNSECFSNRNQHLQKSSLCRHFLSFVKVIFLKKILVWCTMHLYQNALKSSLILI